MAIENARLRIGTFADLHIHTYFSDGTQSPEEIAEEARQNGICFISVCDHNSIESYPRLKKACDDMDIACIRGAEIDCRFHDLTLHVLAYQCDPDDSAFLSLLEKNRELMEQLSIDLVDRMSADYPQISPDEYKTYVRNPANGGWKGIDYLRSKGFKVDYPDCMRYYGQYGINLQASFQGVERVCEIIHNAGGKAVLAHPGDSLCKKGADLNKSLLQLMKLGLDGVECYYPSHTDAITKACADFCRDKKLLITAGSDSHGKFASYVDGITYAIGVVKVDIRALNLEGLIS